MSLKGVCSLFVALSVIAVLAFILNVTSNGSVFLDPDSILDREDTARDAARVPVAQPVSSSHRRHIVIAHYRENLDWATPFGQDVIIMHKGPPLPRENASRFLAVHQLPNVGREAHSFIAYLLMYWDALPARIAFMQADARYTDEGFLNGSSRSPELNRWYHYWSIHGWAGVTFTPDPSASVLGDYWQKFMHDIPIPSAEQRECSCYPFYRFSIFAATRDGELHKRERSASLP